ncbi:MAG: hypothetical protein BroJett040_00860 [Oligoflexia bacterium]|nr:MAG: hypothetical protein BroJett040_00860 [Oligoflexia bacterium]
MNKLSSYDRQSKFFLLIGDLFILLASVLLVYYLRLQNTDVGLVLSARGLWFIAFVHLGSLYIFGAYDVDAETRSIEMAGRVTVASLTAVLFVIFIHYFGGHDRTGLFGRGVLLGSLALNFVLSSLLRRYLLHSARRHLRGAEWLFLVSPVFSDKLQNDLQKNRFPGKYQFATETEFKKIESILSKDWQAIIVGLDRPTLNSQHQLTAALMQARFRGQRVLDLSSFYERQWMKVPIYFLDTDWFVMSEGFQIFHNPVGLKIKRLADLLLAIFLFLISWPLMLLTMLAIKMESAGPTVYKQIRTGKDGKKFTILKFRSMRVDAEKDGAKWASVGDSRITQVGHFIRKTRLDELPQLVNILRGEMSFIGPRPERPEFNIELEKQIPFYNLRHMVQPGLSGLAQILYPYGASLEDAVEKLQYELFYIKNHSLLMDMSIALKTIRVVLFGRGR